MMKQKRVAKHRKQKPIDPRAIELLGKAHRGEIQLKEALMELGIPETQARKGWALVQDRGPLRNALAAAKAEEMRQFDDVQNMTPGEEVALINARLRKNLIKGEDKAVQSAKTLGSRRDLNMFSPDSKSEIIIIECPKNIPPLPAGFLEQFEREQQEYRTQKALKEAGISVGGK